MLNKATSRDGDKQTAKRNNPSYPSWYCFTVVKCKRCGEFYEPICELSHVCKTQNSYPDKNNSDLQIEEEEKLEQL